MYSTERCLKFTGKNKVWEVLIHGVGRSSGLGGGGKKC